MPKYRATLEITVDGDDVDWLYHAINQVRELDDVEVTKVFPCATNPVDYPIFDDDDPWDEDEDDFDDGWDDEEEDDDYWDEEEDGVCAP